MMLDQPIAYRLMFRPGRYSFYTLDAFAQESYRWGARIEGLFSHPQPGCAQEPVAYKGRFWTAAKNRPYNGSLDPDAVPFFVGPVLHEPEAAE